MPRDRHQQLRELLKLEPEARTLLASLTAEPPEQGRTTVDELTTTLDLSRRDAIDLLRGLADAGCGEFKVGRKGHPSRLEWSVDVAELAATLDETPSADEPSEPSEPSPSDDAGETPAVEPAPAQASFALEAQTAPTSRRSATPLIEHVYVLRPGLRVRLPLPEDLSPREAAVLADWVRNLSFDRAVD